MPEVPTEPEIGDVVPLHKQGKLEDRTVAKAVTTMLSGTFLAQLLPLLAGPLLGRMYKPHISGAFEAFFAVLSVLGIFASGRYELAVMLPAEDRQSAAVVKLVSKLSRWSGSICLVAVAIYVLLAQPMGWRKLPEWVWFLGPCLWAQGVYGALNYWFNRKTAYHMVAANRVFRSGITVIAWILLGLVFPNEYSLVGGFTFALLSGTYWFYAEASKRDARAFESVVPEDITKVQKRYIDFPKYSVPADGVNTIAGRLPLLLLAEFFSTAATGYFGWVLRYAGTPIGMLTASFGDVFKQRATAEWNETGACILEWKATFRRLLPFALLTFFALALFAPFLFRVSFGPDYAESGFYAQLMAPYLGLQVLANPLSRTMFVAEKQRLDLFWQMGLLAVTATGLALGFAQGSARSAVLFYSLSYTAMYVVHLVLSYRAAHGAKSAPKIVLN